MRSIISSVALVVTVMACGQAVGAAAADRTVRAVQFAKGTQEASLHGSIQGYRYVDYQLRAGAGQTMTIALKGNGSTYFNLLPPGSSDAAMALGELNDNRFEGRLPDDGLYTVRVYQVQAAARRNATSDYLLTVGLQGQPLALVSAQVDAVVPGTRFHARTVAPCQPDYSPARECEVWVKRRGYDGTATVEFRWKAQSGVAASRRVLFDKGAVVAADVPTAFQVERIERGWLVRFDKETFEVPEPLVMGG